MMHVVVAIIKNTSGQLLIQQRPKGKPSAGLWEFPGGKVEQNESAEKALVRELNEELGLHFSVEDFTHFIQCKEAGLTLDFYCALANDNEQPQSLENQLWRWDFLDKLAQYTFPEPNYAVINALRLSSPFGD